jgi:hypothetical protein
MHPIDMDRNSSDEEGQDEDDIVLPEQPQQDHWLVNTLLQSSDEATIYDPPRKYIPLDSLERYITETNIDAELRKIENENPQEASKFDQAERLRLASWIFRNARQVFATALQCDLNAVGLLYSMRLARKHKFVDKCLPAPERPNEATLPWPDRFPNLFWDQLKLETFHERQWILNAATFDEDRLHYDLPARTIFPFKSIGVPSEDGTFSRVYRVTIHDAHKKLPSFGDVS